MSNDKPDTPTNERQLLKVRTGITWKHCACATHKTDVEILHLYTPPSTLMRLHADRSKIVCLQENETQAN